MTAFFGFLHHVAAFALVAASRQSADHAFRADASHVAASSYTFFSVAPIRRRSNALPSSRPMASWGWAAMVRGACLVALAVGCSAAAQAGGVYKCAGSSGVSYQSAACEDARPVIATEPASPSERSRLVADVTPPAPRLERSRLVADAATARAARAGRSDASPEPTLGVPVRVMLAKKPAPRFPFGSGPLAVGMSDDEALNAPGWGRPARIDRERGRQMSREIWTYSGGVSGMRQLEFANGRLVAIVTEPERRPGPRVANLTLN